MASAVLEGMGVGASGVVNDLLTQAREGAPGAFTALVRRHERAVYSLAARMLSNAHEAEDLAQEVFLQLHAKLQGITSEAHLTQWLRRITVHRSIDRLRRMPKYEMVPLSEGVFVASEVSEDDPVMTQRIRTLVGRLAPVPRAIVLLRYQEDLDPTEISRTLNMSIHTVKSHLKRSLVTLRESFALSERR